MSQFSFGFVGVAVLNSISFRVATCAIWQPILTSLPGVRTCRQPARRCRFVGPMRSRDRFVRMLVLGAFVIATGCAGIGDDGGEQQVATGELENLLLQPRDLPPQFMRFDYGEQTLTDISPGPRGNPKRFGRAAGWKARYRRSGTAQTSGPLIVVSMVDAFAAASGARRDLDAYEQELSGQGDVSQVDVGSDGVARARDVGSASYYDVAWRRGNVTAFISTSGFKGRLSLADTVALARKQDRHLVAASRK